MIQVEMKFLPHTTGTNKLMATYETVKTHIEQYVQKMYKHRQDIAELLWELQKKDLTVEMPIVGRTRYQEVQKCVEVKIRENDFVCQWGVGRSASPS